MKLNNHIQKICCFYASDWHLTVMLLPYIDKKLKENNSIYMRCQNSIEDKINALVNKLEIKNKEEILRLNWNNKVAEDGDDSEKKIYIVSGDEQYIRSTNRIIENYYSNRATSIKIINCYEITDNNLNKIVDENGYNVVLNTKGECKISL